MLMKPNRDGMPAGAVIKVLLLTFVFDTLIALFLTAMGFSEGFWITFIIAQSIGLSCCTCVMTSS